MVSPTPAWRATASATAPGSHRESRRVTPEEGSRGRPPHEVFLHGPEVAPRKQVDLDRRLEALDPRPQPGARHVEHDRPAHPEVRPEQRAPAPHARPPGRAHRDLDLVRHTGQRHVKRAGENEGNEGRRRRHDGVAQPSRPSEARGRRFPSSAARARRSPARPASAASSSRVVRTTKPPPAAASTACTRSPARSTTPRRVASSSSACRTTRERFASGKSLPCSSSCSPTPISRKKATVSSTPYAFKTRRTR